MVADALKAAERPLHVPRLEHERWVGVPQHPPFQTAYHAVARARVEQAALLQSRSAPAIWLCSRSTSNSSARNRVRLWVAVGSSELATA